MLRAALLLGCALLLGSVARAELPAELAALRTHLEARGARNVREVWRDFLFEGEARVREVSFAAGGCVGLLALGRGDVRDVDLSLHASGGLLLADDTQVEPYAYARLCVATGASLYVSTQLFAGRGELVLVALDDAPRELGRLEDVVPLALEPGGAGEGPRVMGGAADEAPFESAMRRQEDDLAALGYGAAGTVTPLLLRGGVGTAALSLEPSRCQRVVVLAPFARGVAMTLRGESGRAWTARRPTGDQAAVLLCTSETPEAFEVRVESRGVRSIAVVRAFVHAEVRPEEVASLGEARALGAAEARFVAAARGMTLTRLGEGWVDGAAPLTWPVRLEGGRCYGLWALGERGLASIDARLIDREGLVVARSEGTPHGATVYQCVAETRDYRIVLRPRGDRGIVSLWLGRGEGAE